MKVYRHHTDIPINDAMLVWSQGEGVGVVPHPDRRGLGSHFTSSVGACFSDWREMGMRGQQLQLMIEAWQVATFYGIPPEAVHEAMLPIPEYRSMLAQDCLPKEFWHEREDRG